MVGIKTWFSQQGTNKTPKSNITNSERKAHGRASMFIAGFIMLTPHRIAMTCAPHILKRYHLPPEVVPLFIYKIHAPMELSGLVGQLVTNIILWICRYSGANRKIFRSFSIVFTWLMFFSTVLSFIILYSGDDYGYFDKFFWSIIFMTFTNGLYCSSAFKLEGIIASMYGAGIPASGFFTFFLHKFCKWLSKRDDWEDFDHSILLVQYWVTVITLFISSTIWTVDIGIDIWDTQPTAYPTTTETNKTSIDYGSFNNSGNERDNADKEPSTKGIHQLFKNNTNALGDGEDTGHAADWSPIFMLATSLGSVYFFYPSISPYQLVDPVIGKRIDLWVQFTAAIPNFGVAILDIIEETTGTECGPSNKHWGYRENYYLWHLFWFAIIPYVMCIYIFLSLMHFPDGWISRKINGSPIIIVLIGNTFNFFQECLESIGFAGAGAQGTRKKTTGSFQNDFNDDIAAFNVLFTYVFMIISMVIRDLYTRIFEGKMK